MYSGGALSRLIVAKYRSPMLETKLLNIVQSGVFLAVFSNLPSSRIPSSCAVVIKRKE
jgi:hypothetical protein